MPEHQHARPDDAQAVQDPVCKHWIRPEWAAATSDHAGQTIYFCRVVCKHTFDKDPERFLPVPGALG